MENELVFFLPFLLLCLYAINHRLYNLGHLLLLKNPQIKECCREIEHNNAHNAAVEGDKRGRSKEIGRQVLTGGYVTGHCHL